jgi:hypothetical protein
MSCSPITYTPDGRHGIGVNQPQSGLDYPLVAPSADIRLLVADFHLAYEDLGSNFVHPLRIKWLYGVGCEASTKPSWAPSPAHAADIFIVDANDRVVFNSTDLTTRVTNIINSVGPASVGFATWCWGKSKSATCDDSYAYRIYEWVRNDAVCRLVVYKTWSPASADADEDASRNYPTHLEPESAVIDERAVYKLPKRVTSFILPNLSTKIARTNVDFAAGLNTVITANAEVTRGFRKTTPVTFNAIPGAGLGKYVDCATDEPSITSLNGLGGPYILITGEQCLWLRTPTVFNSARASLIPAENAQVIGSDCPACCTCNDYVDLANYMNNTRDRYKDIGGDVSSTLQLHVDNISRWDAQRACRTATPIKACMTPQRCPIMDVVVQYCNMCTQCANDVVLEINFADTATNIADPLCGYTTVTTANIKSGLFQLDGQWPMFTANLGNVDAGNSASVAFRLQFVTPTPTVVRLSATAVTAAGPVTTSCGGVTPAVTNVNKSLYCDSSGNTTTLCY